MRSLSFAISAVVLLSLASLTSCSNPDLEAACAGKYEKNFSEAAESLHQWRVGRSLAALDTQAKLATLRGHSVMSDDERSQWEGWAHSNLVQIQHLIDETSYLNPSRDPLVTDQQHQLKAELSTTADELVQVHGLIHGGYIDYAIAALKRLEKRAIRSHELARTLACK